MRHIMNKDYRDARLVERVPHHRRGAALVLALVLTMFVSLIVITMSMVTHASLDMTRKRNTALRTFYTVEAVTQRVHGEIDFLYRSKGGATPDDLTAIELPEFDIYRVITDEGGPGLTVAESGSPVYEELDRGAFAGLHAYKQSYVIGATVAMVNPGRSFDEAKSHRLFTVASISEDINAVAIPLAQFLAFFDNDLEILPGPTMYMEGRVHTNGNLYLGSHNTLEFSAGISAVGDVYRRRLDNPNQSMEGSISVEDKDGLVQSLRNADGSWLDSDSPQWAEEAMQRFGGKLLSGDHGVPRLRLPIEFSDEPHEILARASEDDSAQLTAVKFENKASLRIINGVGLDQHGNEVPLTYTDPNDPSKTKSIIEYKGWYDQREQRQVSAIEINVGNLIESGLNVDGQVVYVDHDVSGTSMPAVRLVNGAELPENGLSVASPKPVYVQGDYNVNNKAPSLVAGDAVNILSNAWDDGKSTEHVNNRAASNTTVNTVMMTGNVETNPGQSYSGGYENLPRFSENWSGKTFSFRGSMLCMWESQIAVGQWRYGQPIYTAPNRDWRYDTMYQDPMKSPPGLPVVYAIETVSFTHQY